MKYLKTILVIFASIIVSNFSFAQGSDNCAGAQAITINGACDNFDNSENGVEAGTAFSSCGAGTNYSDVWYTFTGNGNNIDIDITGMSAADATVSVYTSCPGVWTSDIECTTITGATGNINFNSTAAQVYYIRIQRVGGNNNNSDNTGQLCVTDNPVVAGDEPCTATALPVNATCTFSTSNNLGMTATTTPGDPGCASWSPSPDAWYTVVVPASGEITIDMDNNGTITDAGMAVYSGTCAALTQLACDDDGSANGLMPLIALTGLTAGQTLWVRVWDFGDGTGTYDICAHGTAVPGPCASITNIVSCGASATSSMTGTGTPWDFAGCSGGGTSLGTESIWSFSPVTSGVHSIDVTGLTNGPINMYFMDAATGCSGIEGDWTCIDNVTANGIFGSMTWIAGETYYILFDPESTTASDITFSIDCPDPAVPAVAGDCGLAIPICTNFAFEIDPNGEGLITDELCTACVSNPSTNPNTVDALGAANAGCALSGELNSTWFTINVAVGGALEFSLGDNAGTNYFDWVMWPYSPTACADILGGTLAPVACNWNGAGDNFTGMAGGPVGSALPVSGDQSNFEDALSVSAGDSYILYLSNWSSAITSVPLNFFGTADISCTPLPVELVNFQGLIMGDYNSLQWQTTTEFSNSHFDVEKSLNGKDFERIGTVNGVGTSFEVSNYSFRDYDQEEVTAYYRLKQVDFDGLYEYSDVIAIAREENEFFTVLSAFPNPTDNEFNIELLLSDSEELEFALSNVHGNTIKSFRDNYQGGTNFIELNVSDLGPGLYFIRIMNTRTNQLELLKLSVK